MSDQDLGTTPQLPPSRWTAESAEQYGKVYNAVPGVIDHVDTFLAMLPPGATIIDAGCGTGEPVARQVVQSGRQVVGIDVSTHMLQLSQANVPSGTFKLANMFTYEPEHTVDGVIVMLSLFEATKPMQEEFLQRVASWLKPGGTLLLCVFCTDDLSAYELEWDDDHRGAIVKGFRFMGKSVGFHVFTRARWTELLENAGLTTLRASLQTFFPPEEVQGDPGPDYFIMARRS